MPTALNERALEKSAKRVQLLGSEERLQIKVMCMAEGKKNNKKEMCQRIISNKVVVTGITSAGKGEEKGTNNRQKSCQRTNTLDEKTAVNGNKYE